MTEVPCWSDGCYHDPEYRLVAVFWSDSRYGGESRGEIALQAVACREHRVADPAVLLNQQFHDRLELFKSFIGPVDREHMTIESRERFNEQRQQMAV